MENNLQKIQSTMLSNEFIDALNENFEYLDNHTVIQEITNDKIANNSITSDKIADGAITSDKIQNNSITSDKIADGVITSDKIENGAITIGKFETTLQDKLKNTHRIFIVKELPSNNQITIDTDEGSENTSLQQGDIIVLI